MYSPFLKGYKVGDERVTRLLDSTQLTIIPAVDYDGFPLAHEKDCKGSLYEGDLTANSFGPDGKLVSSFQQALSLSLFCRL